MGPLRPFTPQVIPKFMIWLPQWPIFPAFRLCPIAECLILLIHLQILMNSFTEDYLTSRDVSHTDPSNLIHSKFGRQCFWLQQVMQFLVPAGNALSWVQESGRCSSTLAWKEFYNESSRLMLESMLCNALTMQMLQEQCWRSLADTCSQGCTDVQSPEYAWIWTLVALHQCLDLHIVGIDILSLNFIPCGLGFGASCDSSYTLAWKHRCMWCATKASWWEFCSKSLMSRRW